ncbi:hypothetical protein [Nonomuraea sp. NPDC049400]|uniref:hypothetical protein n=1 Tax=Nonomuraea sp. NPDC049400 TaxID=3364352 RepID=UPI0037892371
MKRSGPPKRKTPLKAKTELKRKTPMPRGNGFKKTGNLERNSSLRAQSKKRERENRERHAMKNAMFPDGRPVCIVPWCGQWADDLHEPLTRARQGSITDPDNAVPTCRGHNSELTEEPAWGYELELLVHSWDKRSSAQIAEARREALARWHAEHLVEAS